MSGSWFFNQDRFLSEAEIKRLRRTANRLKDQALKTDKRAPVIDWFLICVAMETGLRVQEIADLCCGDIEAKGDRMAVMVRNGKGGKPRLVTVRREFIENSLLYLAWKRKHCEQTGKDDPLFSAGARRMGKRALQKSYRRSIDRAGIKQPPGVGIHSIRHTYASFLLKASKFNLRLVQRQLGHSSMRTTEVYAHVFDPDMRKAVSKLYE